MCNTIILKTSLKYSWKAINEIWNGLPRTRNDNFVGETKHVCSTGCIISVFTFAKHFRGLKGSRRTYWFLRSVGWNFRMLFSHIYTLYTIRFSGGHLEHSCLPGGLCWSSVWSPALTPAGSSSDTFFLEFLNIGWYCSYIRACISLQTKIFYLLLWVAVPVFFLFLKTV